jgi:3-hydroxyisobutyrate dehydrogenase-like beta-hydroxyacid dehydrogenase
MLSNDAAVKEVLKVQRFIIEANSGKTIINMSTVLRKLRAI